MPKTWKVPIAYERYGYLEIEAETKEEAVRIAEGRLEEMTVREMDKATAYLEDSEEVDAEGVFEVL